ncbi:hypothetical protein SDC9_116746 [bioreactor metagenome]|uniref:RHS repeat-associated core domain-containing protein n=1 Tax=bioreactor metagenome TaxID=1076179 RepID=A0A645BXG5_9ZZZZ
MTKTYDYDAFGVEQSPSATDPNPYRYCGEYYDKDTGTYYLRARYYSPTTGRFTQEDTHWKVSNMVYGDEPTKWNEHEANSNDRLGLSRYTYLPDTVAIRQSGNLYVYCMNNPVGHVDPAGLWTISLGVEASAAFLVSIGLSGQIVVDDNGNVGLILTGIGGGGTPAAAVTGALTVTTADEIFDLNGKGSSGGGSWGFGADAVTGNARDGSTVFGVQVVGFGASVPLPEAHGQLTLTGVISLNWLPQWLKERIISSANDAYNSMLTDEQKAMIEGN